MNQGFPREHQGSARRVADLIRALDFDRLDLAVAAGLPEQLPTELFYRVMRTNMVDFSHNDRIHLFARNWAAALDDNDRNGLLAGAVDVLREIVAPEFRSFMNEEVLQLLHQGADPGAADRNSELVNSVAWLADIPDWNEGLRAILQHPRGRQLLVPAHQTTKTGRSQDRLCRAALLNAEPELLDYHANILEQAAGGNNRGLIFGLLGHGAPVTPKAAEQLAKATSISLGGHRHGLLGYYFSIDRRRYPDDETWCDHVLDRWQAAGLPIDEGDADGCTPLQLTVALGRWQESLALLRHGADPRRSSPERPRHLGRPLVTKSPLALIAEAAGKYDRAQRETILRVQAMMAAAAARQAAAAVLALDTKTREATP